jgi:ubiquinone/menaquinone biosynthesis C-methylase UbiE
MSQDNSYYDEAYFERGWEKGTAYDSYSRGALTSPTYRELAEAIAFVFKPSRCLEIGCATGPIVRHLNDLGVEAYGVDVSEWAVSNRLHSNVLLAGAEKLPFANAHFDLVFSSHSLEHIPDTSIAAAFDEMDRVASPNATQFHLHPIVGTYPYDYERSLVIANLKKDPTHSVLETLEWWSAAWMSRGWRKLDASVTVVNDTINAELSSGQMILRKSLEESYVSERAFAWNQMVHRKLILALHAEQSERLKPRVAAGSLSSDTPTLAPSFEWQDLAVSFTDAISLEEGHLVLLAEILCDGPGEGFRPLRLALVDDQDNGDRAVLERWVELGSGVSTVALDVSTFTAIEGNPNAAKISSIFFGGELRGAGLRATLTFHKADGSIVRLI